MVKFGSTLLISAVAVAASSVTSQAPSTITSAPTLDDVFVGARGALDSVLSQGISDAGPILSALESQFQDAAALFGYWYAELSSEFQSAAPSLGNVIQQALTRGEDDVNILLSQAASVIEEVKSNPEITAALHSVFEDGVSKLQSEVHIVAGAVVSYVSQREQAAYKLGIADGAKLAEANTSPSANQSVTVEATSSQSVNDAGRGHMVMASGSLGAFLVAIIYAIV